MLLRAAAAIALTFAVATPAFAADITGRWRTPGNGGEVEVYQCGAAICGRLISSTQIAKDPSTLDARNENEKLKSRKLKGLTFLTGFTGGPTKWENGKVYNPEDGKTYSGSITAVD